MRRSRKLVSILLTMAMLATLLVPLAAPAGAATINRVSNVPSIADDATNQAIGSLTFKEDDDFQADLQNGQTFTITFPQGVKLQDPLAANFAEIYVGGAWVNLAGVTKSGDYTVDVTISGLVAPANDTVTNSIRINPVVTIDGFDGGDINVTVDEMDSSITGGQFVLGRVSSDTTSATAISVEDIGEDGGQAGTIRITENSIGALGNGLQSAEFKLPSHFKWDTSKYNIIGVPGAAFNVSNISFLSGLSGTKSPAAGPGAPAAVEFSTDKRTMTINYDTVARTQRGILQIDSYIIPDNDADFGEVEVSISGDVDDADLVIANYVDFGVTVTADSAIEDFFPGEYDSELADLKIEELTDGSIVQNRKTTIEFPTWVKITDVDVKDSKNLVGGDGALQTEIMSDIDGTDNTVEFSVDTAAGTSEFTLVFTVSLKGNANGDITANLSGRSGIEGDVVLGKAVDRVAVNVSEVKDVKVGMKNQPIGDITITEAAREAIMDDSADNVGDDQTAGVLRVVLKDGLEWSSTPTVTVTEGNLSISEDDVDTDGGVLTIPVDSTSTKASVIKITDGKVDLDRTIPEGAVDVRVEGPAVILNNKDGDGWFDGSLLSGGDGTLDEGEFDQDWAVKATVANVATPAPGETKASAAFVIGSTTYLLNGVETTMDVAPYIKDGRTYLPIRYVAYALGLNDSNILWDGATAKVTLIKGDKVVQLTIGSNVLMVNGASITMDVAPEIVSDRTMLPIRHVAEVLGSVVGWDAATQTVTIN